MGPMGNRFGQLIASSSVKGLHQIMDRGTQEQVSNPELKEIIENHSKIQKFFFLKQLAWNLVPGYPTSQNTGI
jgi:hypothetical protein